MCKLMGYDGGNYLFFQRGRLFSHQQAGLSESDESPVLHGSSQKVRNGHQVWQKKEGANQGV